jgi:hypothetical protein
MSTVRFLLPEYILRLSCLVLILGLRLPVHGQTLTGRWLVTAYQEQGVPVDKLGDAEAQARLVYERVREERARYWYGYDAEWADRRTTRAYQEWAARDSAQEVTRVSHAIRMPYVAVFFADSTLSSYNLDTGTRQVYFPQAWRYVYDPTTRGLDLYPTPYEKWETQVLLLTETRLRIFILKDAEVVELVRTDMQLP